MLFFCLFQCFTKKEYRMESKRNETFRRVIIGTNAIQETWSGRQEADKEATRQEGAPQGGGRAPHPCGPLVAPLTDFLCLYILAYPKNIQEHHENLIPPPQTFCTREIPSWSLRRRCARGGIHHEGPLHHLQGLSDEL